MRACGVTLTPYGVRVAVLPVGHQSLDALQLVVVHGLDDTHKRTKFFLTVSTIYL